jgi:hypothetical protein
MAIDVKDNVKKITEKTIKEGGVLATLYFDIHAKTKEDVQKLGAGFLEHFIKTPGVVYAVGEINEPIENEEGKNVSSSIEVKILTRNFLTLANICLEHSPFSVEINQPDNIVLPLNQAIELLGQLSVTTAEYKKNFLMRLATPQELAELQKQLALRAEMGKRLLEKGEKKE